MKTPKSRKNKSLAKTKRQSPPKTVAAKISRQKSDTPAKSLSDTEGRNEESLISLGEEQKEIVQQFFRRFSAGDIPGVMSLFREDAAYWIATTRETLGVGQLAQALKFVQSRLDVAAGKEPYRCRERIGGLFKSYYRKAA